jgi:hypothetical protein
MFRRGGRYPSRVQDGDRDEEEEEEEEEEEPMVTYELDPFPKSFFGEMPSQDASSSPPSSITSLHQIQDTSVTGTTGASPSSNTRSGLHLIPQQHTSAAATSLSRSRSKRSRNDSDTNAPFVSVLPVAHVVREVEQQQQQQQVHRARPLPLPLPPSHLVTKRARTSTGLVATTIVQSNTDKESKSKEELDELMSLAMSVVAAAANNNAAATRQQASSSKSLVAQQRTTTSTITVLNHAQGGEKSDDVIPPVTSSSFAAISLHQPQRSAIPSPPKHSRPNLKEQALPTPTPMLKSNQHQQGQGVVGRSTSNNIRSDAQTASSSSSIIRQTSKPTSILPQNTRIFGKGEGVLHVQAVQAAAAAAAAQSISRSHTDLNRGREQEGDLQPFLLSSSIPPPLPTPKPTPDRSRAWDIGDEFNQVLLPRKRSEILPPKPSSGRGGGGGAMNSSTWGHPVVSQLPRTASATERFRVGAPPPPSHSLQVDALVKKAQKLKPSITNSSGGVPLSSSSSSLSQSLTGIPLSRILLKSEGKDKLIGVSQLSQQLSQARPIQSTPHTSQSYPTGNSRGKDQNQFHNSNQFHAASVPSSSTSSSSSSQKPPVPSSSLLVKQQIPRATSVSPDLSKSNLLPAALKEQNNDITDPSILLFKEEEKLETAVPIEDAVEDDDDEEDEDQQHTLKFISSSRHSSLKTGSGKGTRLDVIDQANRSIAINTLASLLEPPPLTTNVSSFQGLSHQNPMQQSMATTTASDIPSFLLDLLEDGSNAQSASIGCHISRPDVATDTSEMMMNPFPIPSTSNKMMKKTIQQPYTPMQREKKLELNTLTEGHLWTSPSRRLEPSSSSSASSLAATRAKLKKAATSIVPTSILQPSLVAQLQDLRRRIDSEVAMFTHSSGPTSSSSTSVLRNRGSITLSVLSIETSTEVSTSAASTYSKGAISELIIVLCTVDTIIYGSDLKNKSFDSGPDTTLIIGNKVLVAFSFAKATSLGIIHRKDSVLKNKQIILYAPFDILTIPPLQEPLTTSSLSLSLLMPTSKSMLLSTLSSERNAQPTLLLTSTHFCELITASTRTIT